MPMLSKRAEIHLPIRACISVDIEDKDMGGIVDEVRSSHK